MAREISKFMKAQVRAEELEKLYNQLVEDEKDAGMRYECVGKKTEQAVDWRTHELLWEDEEHTIPKYEDKYDYVEIPKEELFDRDIARMMVIAELKKEIEKLI